MKTMFQLAVVALFSYLGLALAYSTIGVPYQAYPFMGSTGYGYTPFSGSTGLGGFFGGTGGGIGGVFGNLIYLFLFLFFINILFSNTGLGGGSIQTAQPRPKVQDYHYDHYLDHLPSIEDRLSAGTVYI